MSLILIFTPLTAFFCIRCIELCTCWDFTFCIDKVSFFFFMEIDIRQNVGSDCTVVSDYLKMSEFTQTHSPLLNCCKFVLQLV